MAISAKEIVTGRKTFFITHYISLIPESFLEDYFVQGFECYFVTNDKRIPLETKLDIIISLFPDVILFFNIDYESDDMNWPRLIKRLVTKYNNKAQIGVMYLKRQSKEFRAQLEHLYLYDIGLNCGCIQLEYQKKRNYEIISTILEANQAQGRRVNIRAICSSACTFSFEYKGQNFSGALQDISLSHFSILLPIDALDITISKKIDDIHINLKGVLYRTNAILMAQREMKGQMLYVFALITSDGNKGIEPRMKDTMVDTIYKLMDSNCHKLLNEVFDRTREKLQHTSFERAEEY